MAHPIRVKGLFFYPVVNPPDQFPALFHVQFVDKGGFSLFQKLSGGGFLPDDSVRPLYEPFQPVPVERVQGQAFYHEHLNMVFQKRVHSRLQVGYQAVVAFGVFGLERFNGQLLPVPLEASEIRFKLFVPRLFFLSGHDGGFRHAFRIPRRNVKMRLPDHAFHIRHNRYPFFRAVFHNRYTFVKKKGVTPETRMASCVRGCCYPLHLFSDNIPCFFGNRNFAYFLVNFIFA